MSGHDFWNQFSSGYFPMFKIEILLSCQSNYSRQCEGKVKKEVVKPRFLLLWDFSTKDNMSPASSRTIGLISLQLISAWFDFQFMSAPHHTSHNHPASRCINLNFLMRCNLDVLWRLWGQERNEKRGRKLEIDTRVRVEENFNVNGRIAALLRVAQSSTVWH